MPQEAALAEGLVDGVPSERLLSPFADAPEQLLDLLEGIAETGPERACTVAETLASIESREGLGPCCHRRRRGVTIVTTDDACDE